MRIITASVAAVCVLIVSCISQGQSALAQDQARLSIELNDMANANGTCRVSFLIKNGLKAEVTDLAFELVLFGKDNRIMTLVSVSAGKMPINKLRVRQFDLKNVDCDKVGRVLLNDITRCKGEALSPDSCLAATRLTTQTKIPFLT